MLRFIQEAIMIDINTILGDIAISLSGLLIVGFMFRIILVPLLADDEERLKNDVDYQKTVK